MSAPTFKPGDPVTVLPPYEDDPYIIKLQRYGKVAAIQTGPTGVQYTITLGAAHPPDQEFGPFSEGRLARGWLDQSGNWR